MKVVGLVTEYNPFHNGHKYHIEEAKRVTGADCCIAVMSGSFVQRGTPAVIDKYSRTEMALRNGVDLVLELPTCYATGSAEYFAHGAVSLLDKLGIVDYLCFGSECGDIRLLSEAAGLLLHTTSSFEERLQSLVKEGLTYPAARLKALQHYLEDNSPGHDVELLKVLSEPNNILGIEYLKALHNLNSAMLPFTIQRISAHYHDKQLAGLTGSDPNFDVSLTENLMISSATAIRKAIHSKADDAEDYFEQIRHSVPEDVYLPLKEKYLRSYPVTEEDFAQIMRYKLLTEDNQTLSGYLDITSDLADRMKNRKDYYESIEDLALGIKTKNVTLTRVNRALIHLLLNIRTEDILEYNRHGYSQYARVLGVKKESSHLLRKIEKLERIPVITKVSKAEDKLVPLAMRMLNLDIFASHLYNQIVYEKYGTILPNEYKHGVCII